MLFYIAELSKYIMALLILVYGIECIAYIFKMKNPYDCNGIYIRQRIYIFLINSLAFVTMCLRSGKYEYLLYGVVIILVLFFFMAMTVLLYSKTDQVLVNNMILLLDIGFIILARLSQNRGMKQFFIVIVSLAIAMCVPYIISRFNTLNNLTAIYATLGITALAVVLMLGKITNGSKLAYTIAGITIQPSEFVKIVFVFFVASSLAKAKTIIDYALGGCIAAIHVVILVLSKDLGSALIFFLAYLIMLFIASKNYLYLFLGILAAAGASVLAYRMFPH
ncbi:MAG: FtsW/RodA/SpoVE family cell cycle protein, partial [Lachnospiraceae bacterium]|nr:FtsW/RodA/SpoVE family cell cycle protein [Lachnospiraceae bacterium]